MYPVNWACYCKYHFDLLKIKPWKALQKNMVTPLLFIHGTADDFIPYSMMNELYEAKPGTNKQMLTAKGATHANSLYLLGESYWNTVFDFINKYIK